MKIGDRVQLHPATDEWMQGDRFGEVERERERDGCVGGMCCSIAVLKKAGPCDFITPFPWALEYWKIRKRERRCWLM